VRRRDPKPLDESAAYRFSRFVQRRPWTIALSAAAFLLILATPLLGLRLGFSDEGNFSEETTTRKAYDLLAEGFGPGFNGPLIVTAVGGIDDLPTVLALVQTFATTPGVASVSDPFPNDFANPEAVLIQVVPDSAPQDKATTELVNRLRSDVIPAVLEGTDLDVNVTGGVAVAIDFTDYLSRRTPIFFAAVLTLSFLLLMMVFRSVLIPVKAVIMNLLSISAAYGVVIAIFQWGWLGGLFGIEPAPIEPFVPMMMFAIVFGLSMDYEVFLLSRIREEYQKSGDPSGSVADGLAATARVITAAAAIMVVVFGAFLFEDARVIKLFGVGLGVAVFIDATIVRMMLVPATMELLGSKNWWVPKWLDRILPHIGFEGREG
jgi:RND superfamily putative drug exporter